ncbi:hypothetical protein DFH09DRAFT_265783 [Mycena vulgaris]|nr:hypothetical protein DFH09DRAFT_265783 [Mycena vulgaris]
MRRGFVPTSKPCASSKTSCRFLTHQAEILIPEDHTECPPSERSISDFDKPQRTRHTMSPDGVKCTKLPIGAGPKEPVSECLLLPGCNDALLNLPGFPQPLIHPATPAFRIAATPDKGPAFFSTRALKMGDLILSERALFVAARVTYAADVEKEDGSSPSSGSCVRTG